MIMKQLKYLIQNIEFISPKANFRCTCCVSGRVFRDGGLSRNFDMTISTNNGEQWKFNTLKFSSSFVPNHFKHQSVKDELKKCFANIITTTNMWAGSQSEKGGQIIINQIKAPQEVTDNDLVFNSHRNNMSGLTGPKWDDLWETIENRAYHDIFFRIQGIDRENFISSINILKKTFPPSWLKAKYASDKNETTINRNDHLDIESKYWYPCWLIVKTALSEVCINSGWNYLVTLSMAITKFKETKGISSATKSLANHPGNIFTLCLAYYLDSKNINILEFEPQSGSGGARDDLLIEIQNNEILLEVKSLSSLNPEKTIKSELYEKCKKIPKKTRKPLLFIIIVVSKPEQMHKNLQSYIDSIKDIKLPKQISGIICAGMFIDATGGTVKVEYNYVHINKEATNPVSDKVISTLTSTASSDIVYPRTGISGMENQ